MEFLKVIAAANRANKNYHKIRPILAEVVGLKNPKKLKFKDLKNVIIDVTVQPIERPQLNQEIYYNGSKKNTSLKFNSLLMREMKT